MACSVQGCDKPVLAKGMCSRHYSRMRRHGHLGETHFSRGDWVDRLWASIDRRGPDECWEWQKSTQQGYGRLIVNGKRVTSHRAMWELVNGPIPSGDGYHGLVVMHRCDNRACCNPAHLMLGTQSMNIRDMDRKGRRRRNPPKGEAHHNRQLDEQIVRDLRAGRITPKEVALKLGIGVRAAQKAKSGKTWKHIK